MTERDDDDERVRKRRLRRTRKALRWLADAALLVLSIVAGRRR